MNHPLSALQGEAPIDLGPYFCLADTRLKVFSVFDDLRFDRSDADILSSAMRRHAIGRLLKLGFRQTSGTVLVNDSASCRCLIPKPQILGASPFDITRHTPRHEQDYYLLTPTQTATQLIDGYELDEAVERIRVLVERQPINLYRIVDHLERTPVHTAFRQAIPYLDEIQKIAVASEPLRNRRALGYVFS